MQLRTHKPSRQLSVRAPLRGVAAGPTAAQFDTFTFGTPPAGAVTVWDYAWSQPDTILHQVDVAAAVGANIFRMGGAILGVFSGLLDRSAYLASHQAAAARCLSKGIHYYTSMEGGKLPSGPDLPTRYQTVAGLVSDVAHALAGFPNVIGIDINSEFDGTIFTKAQDETGALTPITDSDLLNGWLPAVIAACRQKAPNLPVTAAFTMMGSDSTEFTRYQIGMYSPLFDYLDFHVYYNPAPGDAAAIYSQSGTGGKPFFIGEFGLRLADGGPARLASLTSMHDNIIAWDYGDQPGCVGGEWWELLPLSVVNPLANSALCDYNEHIYADVGPTWQGYQRATPAIALPPIRRR